MLDELHAMLDHFAPPGIDCTKTRAKLRDGQLEVVIPHATEDLALSIVVGDAAGVALRVQEAPAREWRVGPDDKAEAAEPWTSRTGDLIAGIINGIIEREDVMWGRFRAASRLWLRTDDGTRHALARPAGYRRLALVLGQRETRAFGFRSDDA